MQKNKEASGYRYKTVLFWDSISLVYGKDRANGEAARTASESSKEMAREESSIKDHSTSAASLKRQRSDRSDDSFTSMMAEKFDKFTDAFKNDEPKGPSSKEILATLDEVEGLDSDTELELYDILTADARKYESLLALPMRRRKRWLLKQIKK